MDDELRVLGFCPFFFFLGVGFLGVFLGLVGVVLLPILGFGLFAFWWVLVVFFSFFFFFFVGFFLFLVVVFVFFCLFWWVCFGLGFFLGGLVFLFFFLRFPSKIQISPPSPRDHPPLRALLI